MFSHRGPTKFLKNNNCDICDICTDDAKTRFCIGFINKMETEMYILTTPKKKLVKGIPFFFCSRTL